MLNRQEQLTRVARDIHNWGETYERAYFNHGSIAFTEHSGSDPEFHSFTREEVEQRKAELQNKPDPSKLPDEANFYAQNRNGVWDWFTNEPEPDKADGCWNHDGLGGFTHRKGEVIGDWKDTLETINREAKIKSTAENWENDNLGQSDAHVETVDLKIEINKVIKHSLVLKDTNMPEEYLMNKLANKATIPKPCYDMSIHSNPNAAVWAEEFIKIKHERKLSISDIDEVLMLAWFANAMMAMHDHLLAEKEKQENHTGKGLYVAHSLKTALSGIYTTTDCDDAPIKTSVVKLFCDIRNGSQTAICDNGTSFVRKTDFVTFYGDWIPVNVVFQNNEKQKDWNGLGIPPEGIECEVSNCGGNYEWCRIKYTGESLCVVDHLHTTEQHYHLRSVNFRKIQSEREKWCASVRKTSGLAFEDGQLDVIYDGLLDGKIPVPTLEK